MSRRVWLELIIQDYFLASISGTYSMPVLPAAEEKSLLTQFMIGISPTHFSTPFPMNCNDHNMIERPIDQPTVTSYCNILARSKPYWSLQLPYRLLNAVSLTSHATASRRNTQFSITRSY